MNKIAIMLAASLSFLLASCGQGDVLYADKAVINLSPVADHPSAGYMDLHGGPVDVALVGVTSDDVLRMEMHETTESDGMASMNKLKEIAVPAGKTVKLEPGGKHLMIWGVGAGSKKRGLLKMTLIFSNDERIEIDAAIQNPGDAAPAAE